MYRFASETSSGRRDSKRSTRLAVSGFGGENQAISQGIRADEKREWICGPSGCRIVARVLPDSIDNVPNLSGDGIRRQLDAKCEGSVRPKVLRKYTQEGIEGGEVIGRRRAFLDIGAACVEFDGYPRTPRRLFCTQTLNSRDHLPETLRSRIGDADDKRFGRLRVAFKEGSHPSYVRRQRVWGVSIRVY